jgi:predicted acetyltransferase
VHPHFQEPTVADLRHIRDDEFAAGRRLFSESIGAGAPEHLDAEPPYWDMDRTLVATDRDGRLAGVAARFDSRVTLPGGGSVGCCAVPNVGVRADQQGLGTGRALLQRQIAEAADGGDATMALNASETAIYGRFGYGPTSRWWSVRAELPRIEWRDDAPADPGTVHELPEERDAAVRIARDVHERAFGGWHGEVLRSDGWWARWGRRERDDPGRVVVAVHEVDGTPDAVVAFTVRMAFDDTGFANRIEVVDLVATDAVAEAHLLRWLCGRRLATRLTLERCNPRTPVPLLLRDERQWHTTAWADAVWVRVLDLPAVVGARATVAADGAVVVRVVDPLVPAVDGTWRLAADGGRLSAERSDDEAAVTLPTEALAPLLWGFRSASELAAAGRVRALDGEAVRRLDAITSWPTPGWCSTGF